MSEISTANATANAWAKLGHLRDDRDETRTSVASAALIAEPAGIRKILADFKAGELGSFIWK